MLVMTFEMTFDVRSLPRYPKTTESLLYIDESCEDTDQHAASGEHDDYPEIKLLVGPVITLAYDDALARYAAPHAGGVRRSQFEDLMGFDRPARPMILRSRCEPRENDRGEEFRCGLVKLKAKKVVRFRRCDECRVTLGQSQ